MNEKTQELVDVKDNSEFVSKLQNESANLPLMLKEPEVRPILLERLDTAVKDEKLAEEIRKMAISLQEKIKSKTNTGEKQTDFGVLVSLFKTFKGALGEGADILAKASWEAEDIETVTSGFKKSAKLCFNAGNKYYRPKDYKSIFQFQGLLNIPIDKRTGAIDKKTEEQ